MAGKKRKVQSYTPEEREKAIQMALKDGPAATSKKLGIPSGTLSCWAFKARQRAKETKPAVQPTVETATEPGRKVARHYTPSQKAEILEYAAKHGPMKTSREFGVSRWSIREWQRKVRLAAQGKGPSPTSGPDAGDIEAQRDREILNEWHRQSGLGPSQIKNQLRRKGIKTSTSTVRRVMEEGRLPPAETPLAAT